MTDEVVASLKRKITDADPHNSSDKKQRLNNIDDGVAAQVIEAVTSSGVPVNNNTEDYTAEFRLVYRRELLDKALTQEMVKQDKLVKEITRLQKEADDNFSVKLEPIKKERDFLILELKVLDILTHLKSIVKKHTASSSDKKSFKRIALLLFDDCTAGICRIRPGKTKPKVNDNKVELVQSAIDENQAKVDQVDVKLGEIQPLKADKDR